MRKYELIAPCHFGLEAVLKKEIYDLGYDTTEVTDGRISFEGDEEALVRANINLRTAERVMIKIGSFHAETFEELFQGTKRLPWEEYIPADGKFWVTKASSIKSKLFSPSDIQNRRDGTHGCTECSHRTRQGQIQGGHRTDREGPVQGCDCITSPNEGGDGRQVPVYVETTWICKVPLSQLRAPHECHYKRNEGWENNERDMAGPIG